MDSHQKILVLRTDNLGDLLLSLPALQFLRRNLPEAEIALVTKATFQPLLHSFLTSLKIRSCGLEEAWHQETWTASLALFCDFRTAFRLWKAGVGVRVGQHSRAWSFLFYNAGLRQKRSSAQKSEAVYCLELVKRLLRHLKVSEIQDWLPLRLPAEPEAIESAEKKLESLGINKDVPFFVLHPGMAGSALNLRASQYLEIIEKLESQGTVLVSVGPGEQDQALWNEISGKKKQLKKIEGLELLVLKEVFRKSRAVIAPSTGPLHLASAVGAQTIGIYSPVPSHHPSRWAPWGGVHSPKILFPQVVCPARRGCLGPQCRIYNCMDELDWGSLILEAIDGLT